MFDCIALISALFYLTLPITTAILVTTLTYIPVKIIHTGIFEIRVCRKNNKRRIQNKTKALNAYLPTLRNKLIETKKYKVQKITMSSNQNTTNNYPITKISNYFYNVSEPQTEKVLKIGQKIKKHF